MTGHKNRLLASVVVMLLVVVSAQATSHVRIVRLSYTDGKVQMDRATSQGLERAILNSPIVEGTRIVTGSDGLAEVEFENNSTVRLGEATEVRFRQLLVNDAGDKVNEVDLVRGTMYFDTRSGKGDVYRVIAEDRTFVLRRDSQVRFLTSGDQVQAAVFKGEMQLDNNSQFVRIAKNDTLTLDATNPAGFAVAKGVNNLPLDRWNNERAAYQTAYSYNNYGIGNKGLGSYGFQDLAYYGGFMNVPGYGLAWQPYGASNWMGWDPYTAGAWAYTPGFGYTWASAYPWGWMPYHYGSWAYMAGTGWFWYPGNSFNRGGVVTNWQATAPVVKGPSGYSAPSPPAGLAGPRPSVLVGRIGQVPAYIPGGPVPPNFRSVITDHSGLTGMTAPSSVRVGNGGSAAASRSARAMNSNSSNAARNGHVFAAPVSPALTSQGTGWQGTPNLGGVGAPAQGGGGMSSGASAGGTGRGAGTAGTGRGAGTAGSHGGSSASPK